MAAPARAAAWSRSAPRSTSGTRYTSRSSRTDAVRPLFSLILLTVVLGVCTPAWGADDPVPAAMKLYEKRRYEQAARMLEGVKDIAPQGQLVLGMIYLRNADLHEVLARTAAAAELDYLAAGVPDEALAVAQAADLGMASYVEGFKVSTGTAKSISFYDLALLTDLAQLYRELARRQLEQAAADARMKPSAEYYLAEAW